MRAFGMGAAALLLLALAPGAAADDSLILVQAAEYASLSSREGSLQLLSVTGAPGTATLEAESGSTPALKITAGHIEAVQYTERRMRGSVAGQELPATALPNGNLSNLDPSDPDAGFLGRPDRLVYETDDGTVVMTGFQGDYRLHVFSDSGEMAIVGEDGAGRYEAAPSVQMKRGGFAVVPDPQLQPDRENDFTVVTRPGPLVKHAVHGDDFQGTIRGDFTLEIEGVDILLDGTEGEEEMTSGEHDDDVAGTAAASTPYVVKAQFIRIQLTDAVLQLSVRGEALVETALGDLVTVHDGPLTVFGGTAAEAGTRIAAGSRLAMDGEPGGEEGAMLGIRRLPGDSSGHGSTPMAAVAAALPGIALLGLPAALGVALLVYLLRRDHLPVTLASVEALLEKGHYGRAARMAGRILRYDPTKEDALISRAVALNRGNHPSKVVRELESHFKTHNPTDGVLHYVLGLSYLDLGQAEKGEAALHEAVRRTPSLRPEVAARLGMPSPVHHMEAHGYA